MKNDDIMKHFKEAEKWVCDCGERCDPFSEKWRFNGFGWEHSHGYPIGHVLAQKKKDKNEKN